MLTLVFRVFLQTRCLKAEEDRNLSDNSMKELRRYLSEFSAYCQSQGISSAEELTPSFLKAYADHRCMDAGLTLKKAPLSSSMAVILKDYLTMRDDECNVLFVNVKARPVSVSWLQRLVKTTGEQAGLPCSLTCNHLRKC